jgi:hypothetical protein
MRGKTPTQLGPLERANLLENRKHDVSETDAVSETSCFLFSTIPDDEEVQKLSNSVFYTPSSEPEATI